MRRQLSVTQIVEPLVQSFSNEDRNKAGLRLRRLLKAQPDSFDQIIVVLDDLSRIGPGEESGKLGYGRRGNAFWLMGSLATSNVDAATKLAELIEKGFSDPHWWVRDMAVQSYGYTVGVDPSIATPIIVEKIVNMIRTEEFLDAMSPEGFDDTLQRILDKIPENGQLLNQVNAVIAASTWAAVIGPYTYRTPPAPRKAKEIRRNNSGQ